MKLFPNLGGEEGSRWREMASQPRVAQMARLWRCLFREGSGWTGLAPIPEAPTGDWPTDLGPPPSEPAFAWLDALGETVPWLATAESREGMEDPASAAAPSVEAVARTHDKAFAASFAEREGYTPRPLRGLVEAYAPSELADPEPWIARLRTSLSTWPAWTGGRFILKPRFGSSARGRVAGRADALDPEVLGGALPRLVAQGGAVLEPWLERREDLATCLRIAPDGAVEVVGSLRSMTSGSGALQGHRGGVDSRGRIFSESDFEEPCREAAAALAHAAAEAGLRGPCGVDALVFEWTDADDAPEPPRQRRTLRPVVELNARFTAGLVSLGLVRRALPAVRGRIGLEPGVRRAFLLGLQPPPGGGADPWADALARAGEGAALVRLGAAAGAPEAGLLFAASSERLDEVLAGG
ncbi:MAG: hypothetical protein ACQGVK_07840 [Myxococcota bacterium]